MSFYGKKAQTAEILEKNKNKCQAEFKSVKANVSTYGQNNLQVETGNKRNSFLTVIEDF